MKIIQLLEEKIESEIHDAHEYTKLAVMYKDSYPETADLFYKLSVEEMAHMNALHKDVVRHIEMYRQKNGEAPAAMKAVYDYLHERHIEAAEEVKIMQGMYKE